MGFDVCLVDGSSVTCLVGLLVGDKVGNGVGLADGSSVTCLDGLAVGDEVGFGVGLADGVLVGLFVGLTLGPILGAPVVTTGSVHSQTSTQASLHRALLFGLSGLGRNSTRVQ